jgi:hypothetical protein
MVPSRWRSPLWLAAALVLASAGVVMIAAAPPAWRAPGIAIFALGVAGTTRLVLDWWRRFFLQQFESRLRHEGDGSYLIRPLRGAPAQIAPRRIDAATKEQLVAVLANGSVARTAFFVATLIGAIAVAVVWQDWRPIVPMVIVFSAISIGLQRWTNRRALSLIATGTPVPAEAWVEPPPPPIPAANLRALLAVVLAIPVVTCLVVAIFLLDPDADTTTLDGGEKLLLAISLIVLIPLPLVAAAIFWRERRRQSRG